MVVLESQLKKMVSKYKYRDLTVCETVNVITLYKDLKSVLDSYVFNDGSSRELMNLTRTIPVLYRGNTYNIPICLWLLDTYPYEDLKKGLQKLEEMVTRLDQEVPEVDKNTELLKKKDEELSSALEKMENQSENNDIDEVIIPPAPLYKQILNLYAEENAIEDIIFYLGEALRGKS
ncbi:Tumor susceptibility gene 101 protein [Heterocephalus glaber]|uniref:Tumor susceptibility gene 101 protein n=1 Tax=Heterocephalus glaber TaxID=10181 RepID=G5AZ94_HETGA|nr:Tumor susceptibility gene 101 protein [Heterocephalus glaber]